MTPEKTMMNNVELETEPSGMDLSDIYYAVLRHKWKIILFSLAGVLAAAAMYVLTPPVYQSAAKLLIPYVLDRDVRPGEKDAPIPSTDPIGIINSELEILRSFDLAGEVADLVGPEKILSQSAGRTNRILAATLIAKNLDVGVIGRSSTIRIVFHHPDPAVVQPVLRSLIDGYQKKHVEIHRRGSVIEEDLTRKTDELRNKLAKIEEELRSWMDKAGVTLVDDAHKAHIDEISKIREELFKAEAELAGRRAGLKELQGTVPNKAEDGPAPVEVKVPPEKMDQYRNVAAELDSLRKTETNLLAQFTGESLYVRKVREQIGDFDKQKRQLEEEYPQLVKSSAFTGAAARLGFPAMDPSIESYHIATLEAQTNTLHSQLETVRAEAAEIKKAEAKITELRREKAVIETNYRNYQTSLEQAKIDQQLLPGRVPNITVVQEPSPPAKDSSKTMKPIATALALGVLAGLGLAFFIELVLDRAIRRPIEVKRRLHLPLFLTIPRVSQNGHARSPKASLVEQGQTDHQTKPDEPAAPNEVVGRIAPWDPHHELRPYYEGLRDRLISHFEANNMKHKPKLIAMTSCSRGAGVTSTAAGLAATLSETGDGNVLLVDMNIEQGAAHPFYRGKPACGLSDVLETETRNPALVQEKLYLASINETADKLPRMLPKRFTHLIPKLKMSDYDYIIFDMPAISQTSITPRLAAYMDMVLLVVESEKTNRDVVGQASSMLAESNVRAKVVLNKYRSYVPHWLHQEL